METNEQMKRMLREAVREELERFFEAVDELAEGKLEQLEEQVVKTSQQVGRSLLEGVLDSRLRKPRPAARREGSCGHRQRLVGERPKELLTLVGKVKFVRPYYQCLEVSEQDGRCPHGEAPDDVLWGVHERRTSSGVQREISYLCGRLTFEEAADTFCRQVPLGMSGRQALTLMRPLGAALAAHQDHNVTTLQVQAKQAQSQPCAQPPPQEVERLYIELDGVLARMRRGSVPMEQEERHRTGDVYREIKAGAVFCAERGPKRSSWPLACMWIRQHQTVCTMWLAAPPRVALVGCSTSWRWMVDSSKRSRWSCWATAHRGLGTWLPNTFQGPYRLWISLMPKNTCGTWLMLSLDAAQQRERPGLRTPARSSNRGRVQTLSPPLRRCRPFRQHQGKPAVSQSEPGTTLPPMPSVCAILSSVRKRMHLGSGIAEAACKTIVSTRAKRCGMRWSPEGLDTLLSVRTAVLNGAYNSFGKRNMLLDCLQRIHTPLKGFVRNVECSNLKRS